MYVELKAALKGAVLDPSLAFEILKGGIRLRRASTSVAVKTLFATHHKVLTAYMARISRAYSVIAGQSYCRATHPNVDYAKDVIFEYHSMFEFDRIVGPYRGIHIRRDPRDVLVSSVLYHLKSSETWLHREGKWGLQDTTYQRHLRSLKSMEEQLLFEMDHVSGETIERMAAWDYSRPEFVELRYEFLVSSEGSEYFRRALDKSKLFSVIECSLLEHIFLIFSARGVLAHKRHIRDPRPSQWKEYFTPRVERRFLEKFKLALVKLGYE